MQKPTSITYELMGYHSDDRKDPQKRTTFTFLAQSWEEALKKAKDNVAAKAYELSSIAVTFGAKEEINDRSLYYYFAQKNKNAEEPGPALTVYGLESENDARLAAAAFSGLPPETLEAIGVGPLERNHGPKKYFYSIVVPPRPPERYLHLYVSLSADTKEEMEKIVMQHARCKAEDYQVIAMYENDIGL